MCLGHGEMCRLAPLPNCRPSRLLVTDFGTQSLWLLDSLEPKLSLRSLREKDLTGFSNLVKFVPYS